MIMEISMSGIDACACQDGAEVEDAGPKKIVMIGSPNVGKSALFNRLTGTYVVVSNYPGTTVAVSKGKCKIGINEFTVVDTPGIYSMLPMTGEEQATRNILLSCKADLVLHVIDAKNLKRMLPLTLQLIEAKLPVLLVLNMIDEANRMGIRIDTRQLEKILRIGVMTTSALTGDGIEELKQKVVSGNSYKNHYKMNYGTHIEEAVDIIAPHMSEKCSISKRAQALLLIQNDPSVREMIRCHNGIANDVVETTLSRVNENLDEPAGYTLSMTLHKAATRICQTIFSPPGYKGRSFSKGLSEWMMNPITGVPLLLLVLYFGLYKFVGEFGAGTVVDFLEADLFANYVNPRVNDFLNRHIPWQSLRELIGFEYGIITLGIRYAIAIILPIVGTFFIAFSIIEDSGYLPRLAMLVDRVFKKIGLNGRAVIPMTLGFGCDTMATMVTRTLETRRERVIATLLLALAIPCSAQLGVILGMMAQAPAAMAVWAGFILMVFLFVGFLTAKIMPGKHPDFYMEVPPLRLPRPGAVLIKTYTRMQWYFMEILPLFVIASVLIWLGKITRTFDIVVAGLSYVMSWIGLPSDAAVAFLFGFFRRDYGAAGLFDLQSAGALTGNQLAIAAITLTLFVPCIAQFLIMKKERGFKTAATIGLFIFPFAFLVGGVVNALLEFTGVQL
jgi:ferrous iron transport protein B